jgi:hypothetical protein
MGHKKLRHSPCHYLMDCTCRVDMINPYSTSVLPQIRRIKVILRGIVQDVLDRVERGE